MISPANGKREGIVRVELQGALQIQQGSGGLVLLDEGVGPVRQRHQLVSPADARRLQGEGAATDGAGRFAGLAIGIDLGEGRHARQQDGRYRQNDTHGSLIGR